MDVEMEDSRVSEVKEKLKSIINCEFSNILDKISIFNF